MPDLFRRSFLFGLTAGIIQPVRTAAAAADTLISADQILDLTVPTEAPDLEFTTAAGIGRRLSDLHGTNLVVNLWATWCSPCLAELPTLDKAAALLASTDIKIIPICVDSTANAQDIRDLFALLGITHLPILTNISQNDLNAFGGDGIPATMLVNAEGKVVAVTTGSGNWSTPATIEEIKRLLSPPSPA